MADPHEPPAPPPPALTLLGPPALRPAGGGVLAFAPERPFLLLGYLACRRGWVGREELADLLYPGHAADAARRNLRKVLLLARRLEGIGEIEQQGELLRWAPTSDLQAFEQACDARRAAEAVACYGGPLLQGMEAACPPGAAEWLFAERRRLLGRWRDACLLRLADPALPAGEAQALAQRLLREDPLDSEALEALARVQAEQAGASAALATLGGFAERLAGETGLPLSSSLEWLRQSLSGSAEAPPTAQQAADDRFFGRRTELADIAERLARADCRVLTLLGPGGVGKSTLALAALSRLAPEFPAGATWVPLADLDDAAQVPARIAAALQAELASDGTDAWAALVPRLAAGGPRLLVLDNLEQLALATPLASLLRACPALKILATSRIALGIAGEWRLPLDGLPLPDADERDPDVLRHNDAVRLFAARARAVAPAFELAAEAQDVVALVRSVEALPLALELLAAWRRVMPVADIAAELAASMAMLDGSLAADRSVRAGFERSWSLLPVPARQALARLAGLPGPLPRAMVREVADVPPAVLAALVDHSLVRVDEAGRAHLHPLIRRCAAERLDDAAALRERHARRVVRDLAARVSTAPAAADEWLPHLRAAWDWAAEQGDSAALGTLAGPLGWSASARGDVAEGLRRIAAAEALWRAAPPVVRASVDVGRAALCYAAGDMDGCERAARDGEQAARAAAHPLLLRQAMRLQARAHWMRGHPDEALPLYRRILDGLPPGDDGERAAALHDVAVANKTAGRYDEAERGYAEALAVLARAEAAGGGPSPLRGSMLINLGNLQRALGRHDEAQATLRAALQIAQRAGDENGRAFALTNLGLLAEDRRDPAAADWLAQAIEQCRQHSEPRLEVAAQLGLARVLADRGEPLAARPMLREAMAIERASPAPAVQAQCIASAGVVLAAEGERALGAGLLHWAAAQVRLGAGERDLARARLAALTLDGATRDALPADWPADLHAEALLRRLPHGWP